MNSITVNPFAYPINAVLPILLEDKTTKKNIIFATDSYEDRGEMYSAKLEMTAGLILRGGKCIIQPRVLKDRDEQQSRTRKRAEVFTPSWVCCLMNDHLDEEWFARKDVFGHLEGQIWKPSSEKIEFPKGKKWQSYIDSRRLEITCGEAPYLVSRYDMGTGEAIPIERRIGILDRKLRVVNENTSTEEEWFKWTKRAFQSVYGYEYQGDNLFIARLNLLLTFTEYLENRWQRSASERELREIARIISRNLFQMDGLKGTIPMGALYEAYKQLSLFDLFDSFASSLSGETAEETPPCTIYDWRAKKSIEFNSLKKGGQGMKFDFIIGNPPYQEETQGTSDTPVYNQFMDAAYELADKVELITPARFLFDAGKTPKAWNEKMLNDPHLKVLWYEQSSGKVFQNTDVKGGVAVTYHNTARDFGAIEVFTAFNELNSIRNKVTRIEGFSPLSGIMYSSESYKFTEQLHIDFPDLRYRIENGVESGSLSKGHDYDIVTNIFSKMPHQFFDVKPDDGDDYIMIVGLISNKRYQKWIKRRYVRNHENLDYYNVIIPKSNGSGAIGEVLSTPLVGEPLVGEPLVGATQTFLTIGCFSTHEEAKNCMNYIKTKFARTMLGILKVTQHNPPDKWRFVPLQDFTPSSDIDWSQSIAAIDSQLYRKYGLSDEEIAFIESHVKEMS